MNYSRSDPIFLAVSLSLMDDQSPKFVTVNGIRLEIRDDEARIVPDPKDGGRFTVQDHGYRKIALVRYFLRYYAAFHKISWEDVAQDIMDFTREAEKYGHYSVRIGKETLRTFGHVVNDPNDPFRYRIPTIGNFELILDFLVSEDSGPWLKEELIDDMGVDLTPPTAIAKLMDGPNEGRVSEYMAKLGGTYHAVETYKEKECVLELFLIPSRDNAVAQTVLRAQHAPSKQFDQGKEVGEDDPLSLTTQFLRDHDEAEESYGWFIGAELGPRLQTHSNPVTHECSKA